jgi:hypothetical protein
VVARTHYLERRGLSPGESLERARSLFPKAHFIEQDQPFEEAVWEAVVQQINTITPFLCPAAHGLAFFTPHSFTEACELAGSLIGRVGLGPTRSVACLAAIRSAPGSVLQVRQDVIGQFLSSTNIETILRLGFEEGLIERLRLFGLTSLAHVKRLSKKHLELQFGMAGIRLYDLLHPDAKSRHVPLYSPPASISESFDLDGAPIEWLPTKHVVEQLCRRAIGRLGKKRCRRVSLQFKPGNGDPVAVRQRILKQPTASLEQIITAASFLFEQLAGCTQSVDEVVLTLGGLKNPSAHQAPLFFERPPVSDAVKNLEERFPGAVRRAVITNPDAPFPEDVIRLEPFV